MASPVLEVNNLHVRINNAFDVVKGLSYSVAKGETLCIVGESGSGKSMSSLAVLRLLPSVAAISGGEIKLDGRDLVTLGNSELRKIRGNDVSMIFQEPMSSLNPLRTIGFQVAEVLRVHRGYSRSAAQRRAIELLEVVHIPDAARRFYEYPHQLSGGMRQRVMIATALACEPQVILADEPTTALDVTIQAQITDLLDEMKTRFGTAIVLITHDMGLVAENADRVLVMYGGRKVEEAPVQEFFSRPTHPYSRGLLDSLPVLGSSLEDERKRLREIPGTVPSFNALPAGCPFFSRCHNAGEKCRDYMPDLTRVGTDHTVACWYPEGV